MTPELNRVSISPELGGRIALVTGAGSGIGAASSAALARAGATVVVADLDEAAGGGAVVNQIVSAGGQAVFRRCDVTSEEDVHKLCEDVVREFGSLDIAHNNAGVPGKSASFEAQTLDTWNSVIGVNVTGVFICMREELAIMARQGRGSIINTASNAGVRGIPLLAPYVASKAAVIGLTRSAAVEYGPKGVRVNAVSPGATRTALLQDVLDQNPDFEQRIASTVPLGRIAEVDEIADAVVWLSSDSSSYVSGANLMVDGGNTAT